MSCAIEAKKRGPSTVVLEQGGVDGAIRRFPTDLVWFSTPELLEIGGIPFVMSWTRPTRVDTLNHYHGVARHLALDIRTSARVTSTAKSDGKFLLGTEIGTKYALQSVVIATGYVENGRMHAFSIMPDIACKIGRG